MRGRCVSGHVVRGRSSRVRHRKYINREGLKRRRTGTRQGKRVLSYPSPMERERDRGVGERTWERGWNLRCRWERRLLLPLMHAEKGRRPLSGPFSSLRSERFHWFRSKERPRNGILGFCLVPRFLLLNRTETLVTQAILFPRATLEIG